MSESACVKGSNPTGAQDVVANGDNCTSGRHDPGLASGVRYRNSFGTHRDVLNSLEAEIIGKVLFVLLAAIGAICLLGALLQPGPYPIPN